MSLTGRHALVGGASKGIGRATAFALAAQGAELTLLARNGAALGALVDELVAAGAPAVHPLAVDLDDEAAVAAAIPAILAHGDVTVFVHNSGGPPAGPMLAAPDAQLLTAFRRTVLAGQQLVRALLPGMQRAHYGRIVNVLSTSVKEPLPNLGVGNVVRGAMGAWAKTLSMELPPGITINNVLPGYTATERLDEIAAAASTKTGRDAATIRAEWATHVPEGRIAAANEIAAVIAFLASPAASYVRGQSIAVDGGRSKGI